MPANKNAMIAGVAVAAIAIGAGVYYFRDQFGGDDAAKAPPPAPAAAAAVPPAIQHPLPAATSNEAPLPELADSDPVAREALSNALSAKVLDFVVTEQLVRNVVASVDNLTRPKLAARLNPVKPTTGTFATAGDGATLALDDSNYARYAPFVQLLAGADMKQAAETYVRLYPLFQQAYQDLGYPEGYFNDRLVAVIDHLLVAPEIDGPILLTQPGVFYQFADPRLESLSVGQKALVRIGPEQARTVKAKLKEFRQHIASNAR